MSIINSAGIRRGKWIMIISLAAAIKVISFLPSVVEKQYTYGIYPPVAKIFRFLLGWLPFSVGDMLYALVGLYFIFYLLKMIKSKRKFSKTVIVTGLKKLIFYILLLFVIFYGLWGLNYSRTGIAGQLQLKEQQYRIKDLDTLVTILQRRLNENAALLTPLMRDSIKPKSRLFKEAIRCYQIADQQYPFLHYTPRSVKPSLFSYLGNYMGFQGYYNPFTGEAQVNTTVPQSVEPFVVTHEIAHQLGYAKESEANFVGFLACRQHPSVNFRYSVYFDMYHYAIRELRISDSLKAKTYDSSLHVQVKKDIADYIAFYKKYKNPVEPFIEKLYSYFLKANNQPKGKESYNEVVTWLIAYYKKYGEEAI